MLILHSEIIYSLSQLYYCSEDDEAAFLKALIPVVGRIVENTD